MRLTYPQIFLILGVVGAFALLGFLSLRMPGTAVAPVPTATSTELIEVTPELQAPEETSVAIGSSSGSANTVSVSKTATLALTVSLRVDGATHSVLIREGDTIEQAMQTLKENGGITYSTREYSGLGSFVESINGKAANDNFYWILYVNGKKSPTGISSTRLLPGDSIEWKYERGY